MTPCLVYNLSLLILRTYYLFITHHFVSWFICPWLVASDDPWCPVLPFFFSWPLLFSRPDERLSTSPRRFGSRPGLWLPSFLPSFLHSLFGSSSSVFSLLHAHKILFRHFLTRYKFGPTLGANLRGL